MAKLTLLTPEEVTAREEKPKKPRIGRQRSPERLRMLEEYRLALQGAQPGYSGDVVLAEGENKRVVRLLINEAAESLGLALSYRPRRDANLMRFDVITHEEKAARPKRGGRPRKQVDEEEDIGV